MRSLLPGLLWLLLGCLSCGATPPPPATSAGEGGDAVATTATSSTADAAPVATFGSAGASPDEVHVELRGLVAFVPIDKGFRSVFLNPKTAKHEPLVAVLTGKLHTSNTSDPDLVATGPGGEGLAIWRFKSASLDPSNIKAAALEFDAKPLVLGEKNVTKLRWVPFVDDILGSYEAHDKAEEGKAAATADWTVGKMTPIFDQETHAKEPWSIGERKATAIADGVLVRASLEDAGKPVGLRIKRGGGDEVIWVKGGTTIMFSAYPTTVPKPGDDMGHFHHFYVLRSKAKTGPKPIKSTPPTPNPARCAPIIFGNPQ